MSNAVSGIGTKLKKGDGASPEGFTAVSEVLSLKWNNQKLDVVEVTNFDSPNFYKEVLPTLLDPGEIDFDMNYLGAPGDTAQTALQTDYVNRTKRNWKLELPLVAAQTVHATWAFTGYITELSKDFDIKKQQTATCKIMITGQPIFTAGS